ncbi:hypothetical protein Acr_01g0005690 [Actinidia rufa]|uniref:Leucine-rich repeat (LRR) family protein n=1 Tax=Actinidia rufa TaxID=165716 RepID=A0A7J0E2X5_9ERIC|nr:hypothetical protein Acr_01g0005690 [Actinidia rufa]
MLPSCFGNLTSMQILDLSHNQLSGNLTWSPLTRLTALEELLLSDNHFDIPISFVSFFNHSKLKVVEDLSDNDLSGTIPGWIGRLSSLNILILKFNQFEGKIPGEICQLKSLSLLDLSQNKFSGLIPPCFSDIPFNPTNQYSFRITTTGITIAGRFQRTSVVVGGSPMPSGEHRRGPDLDYEHQLADVQNQVEFTTKHMSYTYKRIVLVYMSGIDLSCNHLSGEIPPVFSVAHNNLSGATPGQNAQFLTFEESSYEGNPLLCGFPSHNSCTKTCQHQQCKKTRTKKEKTVVS